MRLCPLFVCTSFRSLIICHSLDPTESHIGKSYGGHKVVEKLLIDHIFSHNLRPKMRIMVVFTVIRSVAWEYMFLNIKRILLYFTTHTLKILYCLISNNLQCFISSYFKFISSRIKYIIHPNKNKDISTFKTFTAHVFLSSNGGATNL